ncbi:hypothetical protein MBANPS3_010758 [Mucor bainieri]
MYPVYSLPVITNIKSAFLVVYENNVVHGKVKTRLFNKSMTCTFTEPKDIIWLIDNVLQATEEPPKFSVSGLLDELELVDPKGGKAASSTLPPYIIEYFALNVDNILSDTFHQPLVPTLTGAALDKQKYDILLFLYNNFYNTKLVSPTISASVFTDEFNKWMEKNMTNPRKLAPPRYLARNN